MPITVWYEAVTLDGLCRLNITAEENDTVEDVKKVIDRINSKAVEEGREKKSYIIMKSTYQKQYDSNGYPAYIEHIETAVELYPAA